jgi:hypothetical protein
VAEWGVGKIALPRQASSRGKPHDFLDFSVKLPSSHAFLSFAGGLVVWWAIHGKIGGKKNSPLARAIKDKMRGQAPAPPLRDFPLSIFHRSNLEVVGEPPPAVPPDRRLPPSES